VLRRKAGGPDVTDPIDLELLEAVDEGVSWRGLLRSASCPPDEAEGRLMRLLAMGVLEGTPGEAASPRPAPPLPPRTSSVPARPGTTTAPPSAHAAGESLLRELMRRGSGTGFTPVSGPPGPRGSSVPPSPGRPSEPGHSAVNPRISTTPPSQSVPPNPYRSAHQSGVSASVDDPFDAVLPPDPGERRRSTTPPAAYRSTTPPSQSGVPAAHGSTSPPAIHSSMRPTADGLAAMSVTSALLPLIEEFSHGQGMQRWAAARLREAVLEEVAGNLAQAVAILQVVMAQIEEPRVRAERDRLQAQISLASSGIHRSRALEAERSSRYREAADYWSKVLDASPRDTEAALHASLCAMQAGDLKQAGVFAKRAVELAPNNVNAHKLLHRFFRKTGMERSAKREEEIIQKLRKA
jgi:hypothetical protein